MKKYELEDNNTFVIWNNKNDNSKIKKGMCQWNDSNVHKPFLIILNKEKNAIELYVSEMREIPKETKEKMVKDKLKELSFLKITESDFGDNSLKFSMIEHKGE